MTEELQRSGVMLAFWGHAAVLGRAPLKPFHLQLTPKVIFGSVYFCPSVESCWSLFVLSLPSLWHPFLISHWKLFTPAPLEVLGWRTGRGDSPALIWCEEHLLELLEYVSLWGSSRRSLCRPLSVPGACAEFKRQWEIRVGFCLVTSSET